MLRRMGDTLCVGADKGRLLFYVPATQELTEAVFERERFPKTFVWDLLGHNGRYYLATSDQGVWTAAALGDTLRFMKRFPAKGAYAFAVDHDGLWCGTPFGLWRFHDQVDAWIQFFHPDQREPTDFQVFSLARTGTTLWYGSMNLGAGYLNTVSPEWRPLRSGLSRQNVCAIAAGDSVAWLGYGYQGGYLDQLWSEPVQFARTFSSRDSVLDSHIQSLTMVGKRMYYGGYRGFGYVEMVPGGKRQFFLADSSMPYGDVADVAVIDSNRLALAALFGIVEFFPRNDSFAVLEGAGARRVSCLHRQGDTLWFGTLADGLFAYDLNAKRETCLGLTGRDRVNGILPMPGEPGALLIVMKSGGCRRLPPPFQ